VDFKACRAASPNAAAAGRDDSRANNKTKARITTGATEDTENAACGRDEYRGFRDPGIQNTGGFGDPEHSKTVVPE